MGELTDPLTWRSELTGSDVVFHLAAETDVAADRERHELVTVRGTQAAVDAARYARVPRFVHCGSEAALLAGAPLVEVDETAPLRPDSEAAYSAVKAVAEKIVLDANTPGFATVSIRPRFVWGPDSFLVEGLAAAAKAGQFAWIDGGQHTTDVTFVENAVEGLVLGWQRGRPGQAYFITDRHRVILREFLETQFEIYGVDVPIPDMDAETAADEVPVPLDGSSGSSAPCGRTRPLPSSDTSPLSSTPPAWTPSGTRWRSAAHETPFTVNRRRAFMTARKRSNVWRVPCLKQ
ncbi:NAD-dependent epimerase/dehydratase family protein [Streptomyces sp. M19]